MMTWLIKINKGAARVFSSCACVGQRQRLQQRCIMTSVSHDVKTRAPPGCRSWYAERSAVVIYIDLTHAGVSCRV